MPDQLAELSVPTVHQLEAALLLGNHLLRAEAIAETDLFDTYVRLPTEGLFDVTALGAAEQVLCGAGLVARDDGYLRVADGLAQVLDEEPADARNEILRRYLGNQPPLWLVAAAGGGDIDEILIPDAAKQTLDALLPDAAERREALLIAAGHRFDDTATSLTGALAEDGVVAAFQAELAAAGRPDLAARVRRVSLASDRLGYDVTAPRIDGGSRRAEVKGTRTNAPVVDVFISRNEADWGRHDPNWSLVVCRVDENGNVAIVGWTTGERVAPQMPIDPPFGGKWQSARCTLDIDADLTAGLPPC
jgi:hypothetical protein